MLEELPEFFSQNDISAAQDRARNIRDNPQSILPPLAGLGQYTSATNRDALLSALLGSGQGSEAAAAASRTGSPLAAVIAGITGAARGVASAPPEVIAEQRAAQEAQRRIAAMATVPIENFSPALVQAHPELKGLPLAIVHQIAPILEKMQAFQDQHYNLDQAAALASPDQNPEVIAKKRAELAALFPKTGGVIPKDFIHVAAMNNRLEITQGEKQDQFIQKQKVALGEALDPSKARGGQFVVSKNVFDRAERLQSMAAASLGNPDRRQIEELAIGINAMLSGSNIGAVEQVKALIPQSFVGNANKFREWLTNNPTGTGQQDFVKRLLDTVSREKETAAAQIQREQLRRSLRFSLLEKASPNDFFNQLQSYGIEPDQYLAWKASGFKAASAVQNAPESDLQSSARAELRRRGIQ